MGLPKGKRERVGEGLCENVLHDLCVYRIEDRANVTCIAKDDESSFDGLKEDLAGVDDDVDHARDPVDEEVEGSAADGNRSGRRIDRIRIARAVARDEAERPTKDVDGHIADRIRIAHQIALDHHAGVWTNDHPRLVGEDDLHLTADVGGDRLAFEKGRSLDNGDLFAAEHSNSGWRHADHGRDRGWRGLRPCGCA